MLTPEVTHGFDLRTPTGVEAVRAVAADPRAALLALDFDGVLSPIVDDPDRAWVHPAAVKAVARLGRQLGTVAVITGRPVRKVVELGGFPEHDGLSDMIILGQYGVERWDARSNEFQIPPPPQGIDEVEAAIPEIVSRLGLTGVQIEHKLRAVGVHTRNADDPEAAYQALQGPITELARRHDLHVEPGKHVLEVRPPGQDKGRALRALVEERGAGAVMFAGDDLGDLPAYAEVKRQRSEEARPGLLICSASEEQDALVADADVVCHGVEGVAAWLEQLADLLESGQTAVPA